MHLSYECDLDQITLYPDIDELLSDLLSQIRQILSEKLVGLYLYGSLVTGDFVRGTSDIDLLAATSADLDDDEFRRLQDMHRDFAVRHPAWDGRIEVAYLSTLGLRTFRTRTTPIAVISPGEPFHFKEAGKEWLINWWMVRERGVTLYGPPPTALIGPISKREYLCAVQEHAQYWRERIEDVRDRKGQSYAILTMCRALYAAREGEQASKKQAALWTQELLPEWRALIQAALEWRVAVEDGQVDHEATLAETKRFVSLIVDLCASSGGDTHDG